MKTLCTCYAAAMYFLLTVHLSYAQNQQPVPYNQLNQTTEECGFDQIHQEMMQNDPVYYQRTVDFNNFMQSYSPDAKTAATYKVPVVIHIMSDGTSLTQITDAQIREGMKQLNDRYRKAAGTLGDGSGVDMDIEFVLAVRDPNGNCTDGIVRYDLTSDPTYVASGVFRQSSGITDATLKAYSVWDQTQYYNIWLVSEIDNNNGGAGIQGYAFFASAHGTSVDGSVILCNNWKDETSSTAAHEMGHAFNLYHTFQGDANGTACPADVTCGTDSDCCGDTPPHIRYSSHPDYWGAGADCSFADPNACAGGSTTQDHMRNYMDYSHDNCQNEFTADQRTRATAAMTVTRASFLESNGNMSLVPPVTAGVEFEATASFVCAGSTIDFRDISSCIPNSYMGTTAWTGVSFNWTVTDNGANTYTSTQQNPSFTFPSAGVFDVTLEITNAHGTSTHTEQGMIVVGAVPTVACTPASNNEGNFAQTVNSVSFGSINNSTSTVTNVAYTDFSCTDNTVLAVGSTYQMDIGIRAGGLGPEVVEVYIDYNNNGSFLDAGELVLSGTTGAPSTTATVSGPVTIPGGAITGTLLRMRVIGETNTLDNNERQCLSNMFIGEVEDYGVYLSNNVASVTIAATPSTTITYGTSVTFTATPTNGGTSPVYAWYVNGVLQSGQTTNTFVSSTLVDGDQVYCTMTSNLSGVIASPATSNTLTMNVTGAPLSEFSADIVSTCAGGTVTFTDESLLIPTGWTWSFPGGTPNSSAAQNPTITYNTPGTYQVELTANNAFGAGTTETKTSYITVLASPATICSPFARTLAPAGGIGITNVSLNSINNTTSFDDAVEQDFSCTNMTTLAPSTLYNISVSVSNFNNQWVRVYIDYNNDGDFNDAGELVFSPANGQGVRNGSFTTPASPTLDQLLRMRVISDFTNTAPGACTSPLQYGQVEDYGVIISAPAVPLPVDLITFSGVNTGCVNQLNWSVATELNNDYYTIERSYNGYEWSVIGMKQALGSSEDLQSYAFRDADFKENGVVYYRLYQTDMDGTQELLKVISVNSFCEKNVAPSVFPNPTTDRITIKGTGFEIESVQVLDGTGRLVLNRNFGSELAEINLSNLTVGMYTVRIEANEKVYRKRVLKQ